MSRCTRFWYLLHIQFRRNRWKLQQKTLLPLVCHYEHIQEILSGVPGLTARKQPGQRFFSSQLFYSLQRGSNGFYYRENFTFPRIQRGFKIFQGANFFQGVQMLISIETHLTRDFPGGGGGWTPYLPSGSAHGHVGRYRHLRIYNEYRLIQTTMAAHKQLVSAQL